MSQTTSSTAPPPLFTKRRPPELNFGRPPSQSNLSSFPKSHYPPSPALPSPANYDYPMPSPLGRRNPLPRSPLAPPSAPSMTSKPSSSTLYQSAMANQSDRRLKSQYPRESAENHVEFILVASFDIDKGPIMEHQYPAPISGDESMLAELMLPEGTHNRAQDWTIFFLHKDAGSDDNPDTPGLPDRPSSRWRGDDDASSMNGSLYNTDENGDDEAVDGPPLIYVLNLVNTKHDPTVKRGAVVKAMAICTRHPFLHIYKPLLLLALEEYFRSPTIENLASLYRSVNSMDLSLMPKLSLLERIILQASTAKDLFAERFEAMIEARKAEDAAERDGREATKYMVPRDTHEFESKIVYNGIAVPVKVPTARSTETVGDFSIIKLIQTFSAPHTSSPQPFAVHPHLTTGGPNTHPIIVLVNAMITQKRIIFLGHNRPSGEVAEAVLAACALASGGLLRGFTRHAFPYTDLTKVDELLKVPGFVAGVTNPAFANKPEWWDLLCDLPSGRMKISSKIDPAPLTDGLASFQQQNPSAVNLSMNPQHLQAQDYTGDAAFMDSVQRNISNRLGEGVIRSMWRDWIVKLTRIAAAFEEIVYGASALYIGGDQADQGQYGLSGHGYVWSDEASRQRELAGNISRIEGWRATRSYYSFKQDLIHLWNSRPIRTVDLHHHHDRLRSHKLQKNDSAAIYLGFSAMIHTEAEISQLLTVTSESHGGLFFISLGLLHPRKDVRYKTVELLSKVQTHEAGKHFWETLGRFAKFAFYRIKREKEQGEGDTDLSRTTTLMAQTSVESA